MNNTNMKFNDELVTAKMGMLGNIKMGRYFIDASSVELVKMVLELAGDSPEELQAKRNSIVKLTSDMKDVERKNGNFETYDEISVLQSSVVSVIDSILLSEVGAGQ